MAQTPPQTPGRTDSLTGLTGSWRAASPDLCRRQCVTRRLTCVSSLGQVAAGRGAADDHVDPVGAALGGHRPAAAPLPVRAHLTAGRLRLARAAAAAAAAAARPEHLRHRRLHPLGLSPQPAEAQLVSAADRWQW